MGKVHTHNTPELRFPEFKGEWRVRPLGDIATFSKGKGVSKSDIVEDGKTPCIRYGELYTHYGTKIEHVLSRTNTPAQDLKLSAGGEVIVPASGEDAKDIATAAAVIPSGVALGGDINVIRGDFDAAFLAEYLAGKKRLALAALAQGNSVVHLYPAQLHSLVLGIPHHPDEQEKIAAFLGVVDEKLEGLRRKRDLLTDYKRGVMQRLFARKLRFTRDDGTAFPEWKEKPLGKVVERVSSKFDPSNSNAAPIVIELENIKSESGSIVGAQEISDQKSLMTAFQAGDVLFGKLRPYLKKYAMPTFNGVCSSEIWVLRGREISNSFLYYLIQTPRFLRFANQSSGSKMPRADWAVLTQIIFGIPHPDEQRKIADFLSALDVKIDAVAEQITQTQAFKKGLLQQMFV